VSKQNFRCTFARYSRYCSTKHGTKCNNYHATKNSFLPINHIANKLTSREINSNTKTLLIFCVLFFSTHKIVRSANADKITKLAQHPKSLGTTAVDCEFRGYLFFNVSYFCIGIALNPGLRFFKIIMRFCRLQVLNTKNECSEKSKKRQLKIIPRGLDRVIWSDWTQWESIRPTYSMNWKCWSLLLCIFLNIENVNSYVVFSNPKPQLAHSG